MSQTKILIAAYSSAFGYALSGMLSHQNHEPTLVMRGTEALSYLREGSFDLCLVQDRLPDLSGLDLCEQFFQGISPKTIPIMVFSHQAEMEQAAREKGASGFVKLPCRPEMGNDSIHVRFSRFFLNTPMASARAPGWCLISNMSAVLSRKWA